MLRYIICTLRLYPYTVDVLLLVYSFAQLGLRTELFNKYLFFYDLRYGREC